MRRLWLAFAFIAAGLGSAVAQTKEAACPADFQNQSAPLTCSCAPEAATAPVALWWGRTEPSAEQMADLCRVAEVVSVRAAVASLPPACSQRLVLDGVDYARGGAVELWRGEVGWRAVWAADVRGDRPWSRIGNPDGENK